MMTDTVRYFTAPRFYGKAVKLLGTKALEGYAPYKPTPRPAVKTKEQVATERRKGLALLPRNRRGMRF